MEVYALVGGSGTGKSHRASVVARERNIELIIDDGLLIRDSHIVAGKSAKREDTIIAAVRRAIFSDEFHRLMVTDALKKEDPNSILVLGTSREMISKICSQLDLPQPQEWIKIEDIATPAEIKRAKRLRRVNGTHVIPAPTVEVKKTFSGYLIDPLRIFHRSVRSQQSQDIIEKSVVRPTYSSLGKFYIADVVIRSIVEKTVHEVEGITEVVRVLVESSSDGVYLQVDVSVRYGTKIMNVLAEAQKRAAEIVEQMTALNVLSIDIVAKRVSID